MGYRWYDAQHIDPLFPFGYGLSYTTFALSNLAVTRKLSDGTRPITVAFDVQNTGSRTGAEVPQIYVQLPSALGEPPKRLVAFQKVSLQPGEQRRVQLTIDPAATNHPLSIFDASAQAWKTFAGGYPIYVGTSSRNFALSDILKIVPGASQ
jgi:beta-glucosidase